MASSNYFTYYIFPNLLLFTIGLEIYESPNVKTALFTELDIRRSCWNHDETNLLRARMIMQDLVPRKVPRDIPYLVEYLRSTEEAVVSHSPEGKVRRIMMLALSDVLGGYLQSVVIPMAKESYYAGNIDYATISRLYDMLNDMKIRVRTNGGLWSRPVDMSKFSIKVTALHLPMDNSELACKALFVTPAENCAPGMSRIAIPYLDYDTKPGAVALPLKSRNLYSLKTAASSHIIVRFYILARQCLAGMPLKDTGVFNSLFIRWLSVKVIPHLYENEWYPGFGSVMRIVETVNETLVVEQSVPLYTSNDTSLENSLINAKTCGVVSYVKYAAKYNPLWLLFLLAMVLVMALVLCACWFMIVSRKKGYGSVGDKSSSGIVNAVLSIYCGLKDHEESKTSKDSPGDLRYTYRESGSREYRPPYPRPVRESGSETSSTVPSSSEDEETSSS